MTKKDGVEELEVKGNIPEAEKRLLNKFGKQKKHTVEDVEYTFQFPGTRTAQMALDNSKGPSNTFSDVAYHSQLMDSVIATPGLNWDYQGEREEYREVVALAGNLLGRILNQP